MRPEKDGAVYRDRDGDVWVEVEGGGYALAGVDGSDAHPSAIESIRLHFSPLTRLVPEESEPGPHPQGVTVHYPDGARVFTPHANPGEGGTTYPYTYVDAFEGSDGKRYRIAVVTNIVEEPEPREYVDFELCDGQRGRVQVSGPPEPEPERPKLHAGDIIEALRDEMEHGCGIEGLVLDIVREAKRDGRL